MTVKVLQKSVILCDEAVIFIVSFILCEYCTLEMLLYVSVCLTLQTLMLHFSICCRYNAQRLSHSNTGSYYVTKSRSVFEWNSWIDSCCRNILMDYNS